MTFFLAGCVGIITFWILKLLRDSDSLKLKRWDTWYLLWLGLLLIASLMGENPSGSVLGQSYRHQGVVFFFGLWLVGKTVYILDAHSQNILVRWLGIGVLIEAVIVILQFAFGELHFGRALGTLGEANAVSLFLVMGASFSYKIIALFASFLTFSRAGILAALSAVRVKRWYILALIVLSASGYIFFVSQERKESFFENRTLFWKMGVESFVKRPILGYGAESSEALYEATFRQYEIPLKGLIVDRSHNLTLDILHWSGLLGLALFSGFIFEIRKSPVVAPFLIFSFFQPISIVHWVLLMTLVNVSFAYGGQKGTNHRNNRPRRLVLGRVSS